MAAHEGWDTGTTFAACPAYLARIMHFYSLRYYSRRPTQPRSRVAKSIGQNVVIVPNCSLFLAMDLVGTPTAQLQLENHFNRSIMEGP